MIVSRGLVGPKVRRNSSVPTGKQVNIPVPCGCSRKALTFRDMLSGTVVPSKRIMPWSTVMVRSGGKRDGVTRQILGAREKGAGCPYREPTQVPLAEEVKACRI